LRASSAWNRGCTPFVSVNAANARLAAEAVDKAIRAGHAVRPLHGIPIAIKDLGEIEGDVAMGGTAAWRNRIAPHTATLVRLWRPAWST
jgi:aspartyl-tRNA(Asn)/glutamyl-tRNA(Gln) amidotransferase subunit A